MFKGAESLLFIVAMFAVMYFFMIRPQQKKAKEQANFRNNLKEGDTIMTLGGVHGKIAAIESDDTIWLEIDRKGTKMKMEKSAISGPSTKFN
jgi:preprotein translocase subunit YajC